MHTTTTASPSADAEHALAPLLELTGVNVDFGTTRVLHDLDLTVDRGEFIALLGPSGSGKTTTIRAIAGFTPPSSGSITLDGKELSGTPIHKRNIGIVFQSYALFPHMTVRDNIAYSLNVRKWRSDAIRTRVDELIELVRLGGHADKRPAKLSGGQQQRVALARALAMDPELLLLDEPLSNLDANLRRDVGEEIRRLQQKTGTTTIMVTHDRQEAFSMADRIAVLQDGRIRQLDTPLGIYRSPNSAFMAEFVGAANLLPILPAEPGQAPDAVRTAIGLLTTKTSLVNAEHVLVRPEDVRITTTGTGLPARVMSRFFYGSTLQLTLQVGDTSLEVSSAGTLASDLATGDSIGIEIAPEDVILVPKGS